MREERTAGGRGEVQYVQRPCGQREHTAEQGDRGLSEAGEVKGTGPHPENNQGQCKGFSLDSDVVTSPAEEHHSDWSRLARRGGGGMEMGGQKGGSYHMQQRSKAAWPHGGSREGNVDTSESTEGEILMDLEVTSQRMPGVQLVHVKGHSLRWVVPAEAMGLGWTCGIHFGDHRV